MDTTKQIVPWSYKDHDNFLLVLLEPHLRLAFVDELPDRDFVVQTTRYIPINTSDFNGFYDWLRNQDEHDVIGVGFQPIVDGTVPTECINDLPYVDMADNYIRVFFGMMREFNPKISVSQLMTGNNIYKCDSGRYALSFDVEALSKEACENITKYKPLC